MNSRGYQFFPPPAPPGVVPNPFVSFVPAPGRPPPFLPYPSNPYTFGFPSMPQDMDPRYPVPIPPPLQHPLPGHDSLHNFFQQASFAPHPQTQPLPLTVRSGVYDLRAVEEHMANTLKEGSFNAESSPQPLSVPPPPRGHFTSAQNDSQATTSAGVVGDDPTTYWLGIDAGSNEFAENANTAPPPSSSSRSRRNKHNANSNNNSNTTSPNNSHNITSPKDNFNAITSPTTNGINLTGGSSDSPNGDVNGERSDEGSTINGSPTNGTNGIRYIKKGYPFSGPSTSTTTSDFSRNNNRNRQIHTSRNVTKRYVPKPNDATFKTSQPDASTPSDSLLKNLQVDLEIPPDPNMTNLAKLLQESTVTGRVPNNKLPEQGELMNSATEALEGEDLLSPSIERGASPSSPALEGMDRGESISLKQRPKGRTFALPRRELIDLISVDCRSIFEALQPPLTDLHAKIAFLSRLQRMVEGYWPNFNPKLHMFGSSANEMCFKNGDIDMCLTIEKGAGQEKTVVNKLSMLLERKGMTNVLALPHARVPIVKFKDPKSRFLCDICINNSLALQNTRLVADYSKLDPRFRPLAYLVKYWAKRRGINYPYQGTLSSYAYINLVLNFLQTRDPPVLPCLQNLAANEPERVIIDKFDCTYASPAPYIGFGEANTQSISELLCQFFHYYTNEYDIRNGVVSVRCGTVLSKKEKGWDSMRLQRDNMLFAIEDPFETTHNLGRLVDKEGLHAINTELRRACVLLRNEGSFLTVCKERGVIQ